MPDGHRILPDGCMEFVFQPGDAFLERQSDGGWRLQPHLLLVGQMERRTDIRPSGVIHTVGVHFRPAGAAALVSGDLSRFLNRIVPLDTAIDGDLDPLVRSLRRAPSARSRASLIQRFLRSRLRLGDPAMAEAADRLADPSAPMDIESLAHCVLSVRFVQDARFQGSLVS